MNSQPLKQWFSDDDNRVLHTNNQINILYGGLFVILVGISCSLTRLNLCSSSPPPFSSSFQSPAMYQVQMSHMTVSQSKPYRPGKGENNNCFFSPHFSFLICLFNTINKCQKAQAHLIVIKETQGVDISYTVLKSLSPVPNMPQQRSDQHHPPGTPTMMHPVTAAGPPIVAPSPAYSAQYFTCSPQQFTSQPLVQQMTHYQSQVGMFTLF